MSDQHGPTPSQTVGPFLSIGLDWPDGATLAPDGTDGAFELRGTVRDGAGDPVGDAMVEIWQADPDGVFDHPDDGRGPSRYPHVRGFGRCATDAQGRYTFRSYKPGRVDSDQAPHVDVLVFARGLLRHLITRLYFPDEAPANAADPVLRGLDPAARPRLVARVGGPGQLVFDIALQGTQQTPFFRL